MKRTITPVLNGYRIKMKISQKDFAKITRGFGYKGIISDAKNHKKYRLYGRACDLPDCFCDLEIRPIDLDENRL